MKRYKAQEEDFVEVDDFVEDEPVEDIEAAPEPEPTGIESVFPPEYIEPLRGLLFLGKQENEVSYAGHTFLIKTLTEGEMLRIGQLCKPYIGTLAEIEARRVYVVAASIEAVDGMGLATAYKPDTDIIYEKAQEVKKWYPAVISYLFDEYIALEQTAIQVSNALKK